MPPIKFVFFLVFVIVLLGVVTAAGLGTLSGSYSMLNINAASVIQDFGQLVSISHWREIFGGWLGTIFFMLIFSPLLIVFAMIIKNVFTNKDTNFD